MPHFPLSGLRALVIPALFSARAASVVHFPTIFLPGLRALVIFRIFLPGRMYPQGGNGTSTAGIYNSRTMHMPILTI
eukprot:gene20022-biopygen1009